MAAKPDPGARGALRKLTNPSNSSASTSCRTTRRSGSSRAPSRGVARPEGRDVVESSAASRGEGSFMPTEEMKMKVVFNNDEAETREIHSDESREMCVVDDLRR